jgi:hypothetical protein
MEPITRANASASTPTPTNTMVEVASDDHEKDNRLLIFTGNEILKIWLHVVGYKKRRIRLAGKQTNLDALRGLFGSNPKVIAKILRFSRQRRWRKLKCLLRN